MKEAMLAGIARVAPDIFTFATPIFTDCAGKFFSQRDRSDIVAGFDKVSIGEELRPVSTVLWTSQGKPCIHGFEISNGEFLFGSAPRLAHFLSANEGQWNERQRTAESVRRFIDRVRSAPSSAGSDSTPLVRAFAQEWERNEKQLYIRDEGGVLELNRSAKPSGYSGVYTARTNEEFRWHCTHFSESLGFDNLSVLAIMDYGGGYGEFQTIQDKLVGYIENYSRRWNDQNDPVLQHLKRHSWPLIWDRATYITNGVEHMWDEQATMGFRTGIAIALHLPEGRHLLFGVDRARPLPGESRELARLTADLQLFATYACDVAVRLLSPKVSTTRQPTLTHRELEALQWTMEGKTAWEISAILGITERTAVLHVNNATHKLGCVSKHQAVLRALRLGLIV